MKYFLIAAIFAAAACTVPPQTPPPHEPAPIVTLPEVEIRAYRETPRKPKRAPSAPCGGIDTGDAKEDVRAKLDCLTAH